MRVIAGTARSLQLNTRPTQDRIKETLFNILQFEVQGIDFLDLFAGSGGIGIEAISRGARRAVFVDNAPKSIRCIEENLTHCKFTEEGVVIASDYMSALNRLRNAGYHFSVVFMDPPYNHGTSPESRRSTSASSSTIWIMSMSIHCSSSRRISTMI